MFLQVDQASIRYPRTATAAVDAVSLGLPAGALGVLVGPSGSGKTSLLRAIAGLEALQSGRITLDGRLLEGDGTRVMAEERHIGMVFQDFALFPHLDVGQNIGFGLRGMSRAQRQARVSEMLDLVGLEEARRKHPHQLSGGQQQRVALARALAPHPGLLLMDEPFSSLDVELRERLAADVRAILKRTGTTALMVTHDQMEAFAVGDMVGVMRQGRLEQWAPAATLYRQPATRFVADFIGHGVLLAAHAVIAASAHGQVLEVETAAGRLQVAHLGDATSDAVDAVDATDAVDAVDAVEAVAAVEAIKMAEVAVATAINTVPIATAAAPVLASPLPPAPAPATTPAPGIEVLLRAEDVQPDAQSALKAKVVGKSFRGASYLYTLELQCGQQLLSLAASRHEHVVGSWIGIGVLPGRRAAFAVTHSQEMRLAAQAAPGGHAGLATANR